MKKSLLVLLLSLMWGVASPASAQRILYCVDSNLGTPQMPLALTDYTAAFPGSSAVTDTMGNCATRIAAGGWQIVIVFAQNNPAPAGVTSALGTYITGGGRAIGADYSGNAPFQALFGASSVAQTNQASLQVAAPLSIGLVANPISLMNPGWGIFSNTISPVGTSVSLARLGSASGIVANAAGTTLLNGFLEDTSPNLRRLYFNELVYLAGGDADMDGFNAILDCNDRDPAINPRASDANCDGIDQNCSGASDEDYMARATTCGVGACVATGRTSCVAGRELDSCMPGRPAPSDATCDGRDDDCSGTSDEDYVPRGITCGIGACLARGATACVMGAETNACTPGTPTSDANCDGVDQDCDGINDDGYEPMMTSCGVGACTSMGITACRVGAVVDSCMPGPAAADDATCDGIDNDCSGAADEDYVATPTTCGVGACGAMGSLECVAGATVDSCMPGTAAMDDASCDGVDQDCSGTADEDFVSMPTSCGVGVCVAAGMRTCVMGATSDSCMPGAAGSSDATCDMLDNDCDGMTDEDAFCGDAGTDAGTSAGDAGMTTRTDSGPADAGPADAGAGAGADAGNPGGTSGGACGCSVPTSKGPGGLGAALSLLGLAALVARRRSRR